MIGRLLHSALARLRAALRGGGLHRDLDEEQRFHLDRLAEQHERGGLAPDEARRRARLAFGNPLALRERSLEAVSLVRLETGLLELRHAVRRLRRAPGFTALAVLTLGLGVGLNAALFSLLDAALLRPLPYPEPERLLALSEPGTEGGDTVAYANLADYAVPALAGLGSQSTRRMDLSGAAGPPETIGALQAGPGLLETLRTGPVLGRTFTADELDPRARRQVALLTHGLFRRRFGSDPSVIGRDIRLDGMPYAVLGVLPASFRAPGEIGRSWRAEVVVPLALPAEILASRGDHELDVVARLRPGATLEQARAQLDAVGEALARAHPETNGDVRPRLVPLREAVSSGVRTPLLLLMGAVALALLVACLNLGGLLLVRSLAGAREVAVRVALGAGRAQALRGTLLEAVLIAMLGGAAALLVAGGVLRLAIDLAPLGVRAAEAHLDLRTLGLAFALAALTTLCAALLPAQLVSRVRPQESLRSLERGLASAPALRLGRLLVVAEVALSLVLLVGGALLLQSLRRVAAVDVGFETSQVLVASLSLPELRYPGPRERLAFFEELERRLEGRPGLESVAFANRFPLRGGWGTGVLLDSSEGSSESDEHRADAQAVSLRYFEALGVPLRRGRTFDRGDRESGRPVAVVNETFAHRYYPGQEAVGRRFRRGAQGAWIAIVGVVADLRRGGPAAESQPGIYLPAAQTEIYPVVLQDLAVRSGLGKEALRLAIQAEVRAIDPEQPVYRVETLQESLDSGLAGRRFASLLLSLFAALALGLAALGIYGTSAYSVSRRAGEMGVRLALGATPGRLLRMVLGETGRSLVVGMALGLLGSLAAARLLTSLLFGTTATDPAAYLGTALVLALSGLLAAALPAWRASRADPAAALRAE